MFFFCVFNPAFAQETITITTYYPSPYGVYNRLRANKMVVGESDSSIISEPDTDGGSDI